MTSQDLAAAYQAHLNATQPGEPWRVRYMGGGWLSRRRGSPGLGVRVRTSEARQAIEAQPVENPRAFTVRGYVEFSAGAQPDFVAYAPTWEAAQADRDAYRVTFPNLTHWRVGETQETGR